MTEEKTQTRTSMIAYNTRGQKEKNNLYYVRDPYMKGRGEEGTFDNIFIQVVHSLGNLQDLT